ncbi:MAG: hypothetical protein K5885_05185 [Bacteroidales bacterium]|nr:hypothetical protein [Bacteroidales bacterium]
MNIQDINKTDLSEIERKGLFKRRIYKPTQSTIYKKEYFYNPDDFTALKTAVEQKHFDHLKQLHLQSDGNLRLTVLCSKDGKFAAAQVFRYHPFEFFPETEIIIFKDAEAATFIAAL